MRSDMSMAVRTQPPWTRSNLRTWFPRLSAGCSARDESNFIGKGTRFVCHARAAGLTKVKGDGMPALSVTESPGREDRVQPALTLCEPDSASDSAVGRSIETGLYLRGAQRLLQAVQDLSMVRGMP